MGPLLEDLHGKMYKKVKEGDNDHLKLHVYSTHDTALAGIAATLDVFDHRSVPTTLFFLRLYDINEVSYEFCHHKRVSMSWSSKWE